MSDSTGLNESPGEPGDAPDGTTYLREKLDRFDPDFQLTSRFVAPARRPGLAAVFGLRAELRDLLATVRDPGVARAKLAWWEEELGRLDAGRPRHPVTRRLAGPGAAPDSLAGALVVMARLIGQGGWDDSASFLADAAALGRPFAELEARADGSEPSPGCWQDIQCLALVQDLPAWWSLDRRAAPLDLVARLGLSRDALRADRDAGMRLIRELAAAALEASAATDGSGHAALYRNLAAARLAGLGSARWRGDRLLAGPGPLRRLWLTWRAAQRLRRAGS